MIIGFWFCLFSDLLDTLLLGLLGFALIWIFQIFDTGPGENSAWIGLILSFLYGGILQSSLFKGQSVAKNLLNIEVVRLDCGYLSLPLSFLRYSVIELIAYNGVWGSILAGFFPNSAWIGILFLGCVLMVPIHPQKGGIHDLIAGLLVRVQPGEPYTNQTPRKRGLVFF